MDIDQIFAILRILVAAIIAMVIAEHYGVILGIGFYWVCFRLEVIRHDIGKRW